MTPPVLPSVESQVAVAKGPVSVLLIGNPNAGKTALFNSLTGLRAKTANYPGVTVDLRKGRLNLGDRVVELVDLPGLYSLDAITPEEKVAEVALRGDLEGLPAPAAVVLVIDATNVERNLFLASEVLEMGLPIVVALNLIDAAQSAGITTDTKLLSEQLECPVVPVSGRTGEGLAVLRSAVADLISDGPSQESSRGHCSCTVAGKGCPFVARYEWAETVARKAVHSPESYGKTTAAIDRIVTKPVVGLAAFLAVMMFVFYLIFVMADVPMGLIDDGFTSIAAALDAMIPEVSSGFTYRSSVFLIAAGVFTMAYQVAGIKRRWWTALIALLGSVLACLLPVADLRSLAVDGIIGGVGGVIVFLPQICILFFFISLLEDSGYLARAAFVMERVMRSVGLPGKAFVPMLSAHACAIPGIMASRVIEDWRDRLVTILVLPLLTCSARLPVYAMVATLLCGDSALKAAGVFLGAYLLGIGTALATAFCLKKTILRGESVPLVLELPPYRLPSLRNALMTTLDRASIFVRKAGGVILLISVVLWAMANYPKIPTDALSSGATKQLASLGHDAAATDGAGAEAIFEEGDLLLAQEQLAYSFAGRLGHFVEPIFSPLGFDWKINVGVLSSFAAREVIVSTMAILYGVEENAAEDASTFVETMRSQTRPDGTPVFTTATSLSLLVFFVLAMQCLPTQVVTKRETGSWKWAVFQLVYMTGLAYLASLAVYQTLSVWS